MASAHPKTAPPDKELAPLMYDRLSGLMKIYRDAFGEHGILPNLAILTDKCPK
jgi:hypothetical protein